MYCRFCGREIEDDSIFCRFCGRTITDENGELNTVIKFLRKNFQLFALIGIIGTMLSLMPLIAEKVTDPTWLGELGMAAIFLLFSITAGGMFIFALFIIIFTNMLKEEQSGKVIIFYFPLILFGVGLTFFLLIIPTKYVWGVISAFGIVAVIYGILLVYLFSRVKSRKTKTTIVLIIFVIAILLCVNLFIMPILSDQENNNESSRDKSLINITENQTNESLYNISYNNKFELPIPKKQNFSLNPFS